MTNDGKDKFVQQMMLDFDKADLDKDGTINFSGKDIASIFQYICKVYEGHFGNGHLHEK